MILPLEQKSSGAGEAQAVRARTERHEVQSLCLSQQHRGGGGRKIAEFTPV